MAKKREIETENAIITFKGKCEGIAYLDNYGGVFKSKEELHDMLSMEGLADSEVNKILKEVRA